jgi:ornithine carbamoyltransferase
MSSSPTTLDWPQDLLRAGDLTHDALHELLALAERMKRRHAQFLTTFGGEALACLYEAPTTRAGLSVAVAAHRLGLVPVTVRPDDLRRGGGETLEDAATILSGYSAAIAVADLADLALQMVARVAAVPVLNARSPEHHPCQALAGLLTLRERFERLDGLVLAYVGVFDNSARSLAQACALAGVTIRLACPPDFAPDLEDVTAAQLLGDLHGGQVVVCEDPRDAVAGADAVATSPWPTAQDEREARELEDRLRRYRVTQALFARAKRPAVFLHSLPVHRDVEVSSAVVDGPRSAVWPQTANRVPAEQAVLYALIRASRGEEIHV